MIDQGGTVDIFGPTMTFLTALSEPSEGYCVLRGMIPPGGVVPLHAHPDRETFCILEGRLEGLQNGSWRTLTTGDLFDIPGGTRHGFRNATDQPVVALVVTTMRLGRFFQRTGRPVGNQPPGLPTRREFEQFAHAAFAAGLWLGSELENAAVGIDLPPFA